ncbi:MAG: monooxygenase [Alphaproteobacteria bacterium]|nr:monooxygenase [Alphaproteobacteria bacterium]
MAHLGKHAIVIGASMGGLLAARALADHYDEVSLLERDTLPETHEPRKGVPQGRHAHGLLARGREVLDQFFPGLSEEMIGQGALYGDLVDEVRWFNHGVYLANAPSGLRGLLISRPMLEDGVRRRLLQLSNVRLLEHSDALEPVFDPAGIRMTGISARLRRGEGGGTATMDADLVLDASGRGSHSSAWLEALGYTKPREEGVQVNIAYMTRLYRRRPEHLPGKRALVMAGCEPGWRFGVILAQEDERWIVTLGGYLGDRPPMDEAGYIEFARSLPEPEIFEVIKDAEPLTPLAPYQFTANLRRHYEELNRFPDGFLVFGDALCSFNPVYGQGMTVACTEALALHECLAAGVQDLSRRFFQTAAKLVDIPWQIAVGGDLQHRAVEGKRTTQLRFVNWYLMKLFQAAQYDAVLATRFLEVANLMKPPSSLMTPQIALRVWKGNMGR